MIDNEDRVKHAERILGEQANKFFNSDLGQFIIAKSLGEVSEATALLRNVEPEDSKSIRNLQENIAVAELGLTWINEAFNLGEQRFAHDEMETELIKEDGEFISDYEGY